MHREKNEKPQVQNWSTAPASLKILFFHNTLPEYRIGWFCNLDKIANVDFVFTNEELNKKDYGFEIELEKAKGLRCTFLSDGVAGFIELVRLLNYIENYDFVELPLIDSVREVIYSAYIVHVCKKAGVKTGYFWEKWEAPIDKQPLGRKVKNFILRIIPKAIYKHVDLIFSVGRKNKEYFLSNGINKQKICWIPDVSETPECDFVDIREKYNIPKDSKLILFLGRLMPQKGVTDLITAFSMLDKDIQDSSFLLVAGNGDDMENCKKLAQKFTIKNVTFVGTVNPTDRGNFFKQCDIFVYPVAYYKGRVDVWGLTVNEAIQHGKVVIATDAVGSAYELIEDGVNGYRVEPGNVELMKNALECSMDEAIKESAIQKDAELFNEFNYINMAKKYIDAIVN